MTEKFTNYRNNPADPASLENSAVSAIYQDRSGTLWLGTWMGTLSRFDDKTNTFVKYRADSRDPHKLSGGGIFAIHEDRAGTLWLGTLDGLYRYNRESETFTRYTVSQGLPSDVVQCILDDRHGRLWISTRKGLSRFDPQAGGFRNYDTSDGLQSNDLAINSFYEDGPSSEMLFGGSNGITALFPENIQDNPYVPPVVLTSFKIFNKPVPIGPKSVLKKAIPYTGSLTLPYSDTVFSFEFAALSYANSQKKRYRYKLENFESGWNEVGSKQRLATYTNLDPGKYVFRVQGSNSDGMWNEEGASLDFTIDPAFWQANWFRAMCVLALMALLWAAYLLRVRQLRQQERQLRDVVETIPTIAWTALPDGWIDFSNHHWEEYTGLPIEKGSGSGWEVAVHPEDVKRHADKWRASVASGEPFENEARYRRADGEYRRFLVRAVELRDGGGKIRKWYGTKNDIEDRKRAEQLQSDLAHVNRVTTLGELAASLSHELKQPIAAAMTNANTGLRWLERETPDVEEASQAIKRIVKDGARAAGIIDHLRSLYKKSPSRREELAANEVSREMVEFLRGEANRYAVSIRAELAADLPKVMADRVQMQQVFMNIMLNGIEAMKETGGVLEVKSQLGQDGQVLISISDTGVGLPAEKADQIFSAFFTTKPQGSGMGLATSRSIIESHGGHLWATPKDGCGATFHFTIPIAAEEVKLPAAEP